MAVYEGMLKAEGLKFAIVCSRFNEFFVSKLLGGALDTIVRHGGDKEKCRHCMGSGCVRDPVHGFQADGHRKI